MIQKFKTYLKKRGLIFQSLKSKISNPPFSMKNHFFYLFIQRTKESHYLYLGLSKTRKDLFTLIN